MNGERAETFLRLLAEAVLRDQLAPDPPPWTGWPGAGRVRISMAGQAMTAVRALDRETAEAVLADFDLAVNLRQQHHLGPAGHSPGRIRPTVSASRATRLLMPGRLGPSRPRWAQLAGAAAGTEPESAGSPEPAATPPADDDPDQGAVARFAPIGRTLPFHVAGLSGELYLLSFAHTGAGARLLVAWGEPTLSGELEPVPEQAEAPAADGLLTVTDDRGSAYELDFTWADASEWASQVSLHPAPPDGVRWLEVAAAPGSAVRVNLNPAGPPAGGEPQVSPAHLSAGEQLLIMLAETLLMVAAPFPLGQAEPPALSPRAVEAMGTGLGDIIAGLEAVGALPPLSPVPAQLAALCASLRIGEHGITAAPADDLPDPWLNVLAYYQRRKPDTGQIRDGFAAVTAALPELDGISLALVGLHNAQGTTVLHVLARGLQREERRGPHGINLDFPLSLWIRDNGGRWHAARPADWHQAGSEHSIGLVLVPPLSPSATWVEVRAGGRSGEARARLPLRWGFPP